MVYMQPHLNFYQICKIDIRQCYFLCVHACSNIMIGCYCKWHSAIIRTIRWYMSSVATSLRDKIVGFGSSGVNIAADITNSSHFTFFTRSYRVKCNAGYTIRVIGRHICFFLITSGTAVDKNKVFVFWWICWIWTNYAFLNGTEKQHIMWTGCRKII